MRTGTIFDVGDITLLQSKTGNRQLSTACARCSFTRGDFVCNTATQSPVCKGNVTKYANKACLPHTVWRTYKVALYRHSPKIII